MQDIRWSMQGYRKALVGAIPAEANMLNMLQRFVKFSSQLFSLILFFRISQIAGETVDMILRRNLDRASLSPGEIWPRQEISLFRLSLFRFLLQQTNPFSTVSCSRKHLTPMILGVVQGKMRFIYAAVSLVHFTSKEAAR